MHIQHRGGNLQPQKRWGNSQEMRERRGRGAALDYLAAGKATLPFRGLIDPSSPAVASRSFPPLEKKSLDSGFQAHPLTALGAILEPLPRTRRRRVRALHFPA